MLATRRLKNTTNSWPWVAMVSELVVIYCNGMGVVISKEGSRAELYPLSPDTSDKGGMSDASISSRSLIASWLLAISLLTLEDAGQCDICSGNWLTVE